MLKKIAASVALAGALAFSAAAPGSPVRKCHRQLAGSHGHHAVHRQLARSHELHQGSLSAIGNWPDPMTFSTNIGNWPDPM